MQRQRLTNISPLVGVDTDQGGNGVDTDQGGNGVDTDQGRFNIHRLLLATTGFFISYTITSCLYAFTLRPH
jgi:hypothetical protein